MVDYVREVMAEKSSQYSEHGLFEHFTLLVYRFNGSANKIKLK